jgi:hypothetical protein
MEFYYYNETALNMWLFKEYFQFSNRSYDIQK